jgi:hypothetical protein
VGMIFRCQHWRPRNARVLKFNNMILGQQLICRPFREQFVTYRYLPARPIVAGNNEVFQEAGRGGPPNSNP